MKGTDIIERARQDLKGFLVYEIPFLYGMMRKDYPNWENDEEWEIKFSDITDDDVYVTLDVFDFDCIETTPELFHLSKVKCTLDNNIFFVDIDGDEHHYGELDIEELAAIANMLQEKVSEIASKKK